MAVCESCGATISDGFTVCPQCGQPVVKMTTHLGLKGENGRKTVQKTSFSPSDDYGDIYDGNSVGGTDPVTLTKADLDDYKKEEKRTRGTGVVGKFFGILIKLMLLFVIGFGIYYFVVEVVMKPDGPETYQDAMQAFQTAINENDEEKLLALIPEYITANKMMVEDIMPVVEKTNYQSINILERHQWTSAQLSEFNEQVQLEHGKTIDAKEGVTLKVGLRGKMVTQSGIPISYIETELKFVKLKGVWYPDMEEIKNTLFTVE